MGSGAEIAHETVEHLVAKGEKVGVLKVRLYRPFSVRALRRRRCPQTVKRLAVLDRTKEPGAVGEPLYQDVVTALRESKQSAGEASSPVIGGRYGLSSKEFTPAMVKAVFDELAKAEPKHHFTVGINDDVTHLSLDVRSEPGRSSPTTWCRALFFGLGADGTVGANKNSIKIIGEDTPNYAQGYFVYDSKKSGTLTTSPPALRPAAHPLLVPGRPGRASWPATSSSFLEQVRDAGAGRARRHLPAQRALPGRRGLGPAPARGARQQIIDKKLRFYVIDAYKVAKDTGMGGAHQHHHADLLLRHLRRAPAATRPSSTSRRPSRRPTAARGRRW